MDERMQVVMDGGGYEVSWSDALQEQFGSVPWWVISSGVHVIVLLLLTLVTVSTPEIQADYEVITTDLIRPADPVEEPMPIRNMFKNNKKHVDLEEEVETPMVVHEEVEVDDHMVTDNNLDMDTARGHEDAISEIPTGGTGVVGHIGVGGGPSGCFGIRGGGGRRRAVLKGGGNTGSECAVNAGLRWLVNNQEPDGRWAVQKWEGGREEEACVGVTGLGLLAFLGAGHTERAGKHKNTVRRAVLYLMSQQDARGMIGKNGGHTHGGGYNHSIAGLALAEAFGMGKVAATGRAAQKAVDFSIKHFQRDYSGWRYAPGRDDCDTSVTGWFIMQLKSAYIAGLNVPGTGYHGATAWLDKVTEMPGNGSEYGGRAKYQPNRGYTTTMTAVAMVGRQFMGWKMIDPLLVGGANHLADNLPQWNGSEGWQFYYWYYGTLAMFQMGGDWWKAWNVSMRDMLVDHQIADPNNTRLDGSWDPIRDGQQGGRAYSTAMCCMCLEVYYRYFLPTQMAGRSPRRLGRNGRPVANRM